MSDSSPDCSGVLTESVPDYSSTLCLLLHQRTLTFIVDDCVPCLGFLLCNGANVTAITATLDDNATEVMVQKGIG